MSGMNSSQILEVLAAKLSSADQIAFGVALQDLLTYTGNEVVAQIMPILPSIYLTGFDMTLAIVALILWIMGIRRMRTKRSILMFITSLFLIGFNIVITSFALDLYTNKMSIIMSMFVLNELLINVTLHSSQVARSLMLIPNRQMRLIIEYSCYILFITYASIIFGIHAYEVRKYFKNGQPTPQLEINYSVFNMNIFFPAVGIITHCVFLMQTYQSAYGSGKYLSRNEAGTNRIKLLFNSTAIFGFCSVSLYIVDIALLVHFRKSYWSASVNGVCFGLILITEFLMDYSLFLAEFLHLTNKGTGAGNTKATGQGQSTMGRMNKSQMSVNPQSSANFE